MKIVLAKNVSGGEVEFLSTVLQDTEESTLSEIYTLEQIGRSETLAALVASGDVVINDGTNDLSPGDGGVFVDTVETVQDRTGDVVITPDDLDDTATTNKFYPAADSAKLATIEDNADVTDSTNVDAAGAVMNSDTSVASMGFVINDPTFAAAASTNLNSSDATKQYIETYVAASVTGVKKYIGGYNASINFPDLVTPAPGIVTSGHVYDVTTGGTFFGEVLEAGDTLSAKASDPTSLSDWVIGQTNLTAGTIKSQYELNANTNAFTDAEQSKLAGMETGAEANQTDSEIKTQYENNADTNAFDDAAVSKLGGIEANATADQTGAEIKSAYEAEADTNAFTDAEQTKLSGIEASADVTDSTNVDAAGATMNTDSSLGGNTYFLDEDNMISDDATKVASQQSIKKYVDDNVGAGSVGSSSNNEVLFNDGGVLTGVDHLKFDGTNFQVGNGSNVGNIRTGEDLTFGYEPEGGVLTGTGIDDIGATVIDIKNNSSSPIFTVNTLGEVEALDFNGVALNTTGDIGKFLNEQGNYLALETNFNHTGEVTGDELLTVQAVAISNKTLKAAPVGTEEVLINDAGTLKKTTAQGIADLSVGTTNLSIGTKTGTTVDINSDTGTDATIPEATATEAGLLSSAKRAEIIANNAKVTNVTTDLSIGTTTGTTLDINSSDGTNATIPAAIDSGNAGLLTGAKSAEITANNAKVSNVTTNLSIGTQTGTTLDINSSDGTNATIPQAISGGNAGLMSGTDKATLDAVSSSSFSTIRIADKSITNSTTMTADGVLEFAVPAGTSWTFLCTLVCTEASANPNIKFRMGAAGGLTGTIEYQINNRASNEEQHLSDFTTESTAFALTTTKRTITIAGSVIGVNAGTLQVQWAQASTDADAATVHKNSAITAVKAG